jgi:ribosomal protein S15P/S13E
MDLPTKPVTLGVAQIEELARHFSAFRHDVNGCLSLIVAATELIRYNPAVVSRMAATLVEQPQKIAGKLREFTEQCERLLELRSATEPSWYGVLWKRVNSAMGPTTDKVEVGQDDVKGIFSDFLQINKELVQLGFLISGARALGPSPDSTATIADQFAKISSKYDQTLGRVEQVFRLQENGTKRLSTGTPSGPMTLQPEQVALFHRRLQNLHRDMSEHLLPLVELATLARHTPQNLAARAPEFAKQPPAISAELQKFGADFDRMLGIQRGV